LQVVGKWFKALEDLLNKNGVAFSEQREELVRLQKAEKENLVRQLTLNQKKVDDERELLAQWVESLMDFYSFQIQGSPCN
jgi:membrane-bound lytic murein transglycosylase